LFFGGLIVLPPTAVYARLYEPDHLRVARVDVPIAGLPAEADGLRIGHISDPHCDSRHAMMRAARAAHLLMGEKPDIVFMTGDYVTTKPGECIPYMAKMLRPLAAAPRGSYAVLGNHDWWAGDPDGVEKQLTQTGFTVLRNRSVPLKGIKDVWIVGLDQRCNGHQNVNKALHGVPAGATKLLLIHEPDYADEAPEGFALQFSGHSHGGQVRIPGLPPIIVPRYSRRYPEGLQQASRHLVYTSRGVGVIGPRFRLFCPPEVAVLRLIRKPA
jgi:predicted MPP superfamily phosphohydrolase